ncbi:MAG: PspA/IM30 family protein [Clostridiales bacterium]|nr:PspA/IM30 family protein [Clostridiales bacterium]
MAILERFGDIIKANINAIIDKMEDPSKMIDQYLRDMMEDFAEVKQSTAGVMAEETRTKRLVDENQAETAKYAEYAKKALAAGNEGDARTFIAKKQQLENVGASLMTTYAAAHENAVKMRQMHDKLASDIETLKSRREMIKAKVAVAKTQESLNEAASSIGTAQGAMNAFSRMEDKASKMLDEANAMAELNKAPVDEAKALEEKYAASGSASVDDELARLKNELGL